MNQQPERKGLRLLKIPLTGADEGRTAKNFVAGPQASLFDTNRPDLVFFIQLGQMNDKEFLGTLERARPSFIFDLRLSPRFDMGQLTRNSAFEYFENIQSTYIDASVPLMLGENVESALNRLRSFLGSVRFDRPLFFLFGSRSSSMAGEDEILQALTDIGKATQDFDIVRVPSSFASL